MNLRIGLWLGLAVLAAGCESELQIPAVGPWNDGKVLPTAAQAKGDPVRGRELLLNGSYMTCGIPHKLWDLGIAQSQIAVAFGGDDEAPRIPGRTGYNEDLPYFLNSFESPDGAQVINANCLMCHGGSFNGELVIGLGNSTANFTNSADVDQLPLTDAFLDPLGLTAVEKANMRKMAQRGVALAPFTTMRTIGMNPAEMLAVVLMAHHDRETLAWSDELVTPISVRDHQGNQIPDPVVTSDPPPWWRAHKKNALFYNGMARGDHRGTMALATSVCVDDVERAAEVDAMFQDIQAYISTIRAPKYPWPVDGDLAEDGHRVFVETCAGCHGTYGDEEADDWYPNLLIPLDIIGTDPVVAEAGVVHSPELVEWYNNSFYGQITRMQPADPFPGYMPPPLDGIWATAPFFHNGSVPTLELVLNSRKRPKYWKRADYDSTNYDKRALGWPFQTVTYAQKDAPEAERPHIYDTTYWSQSNAGHTFGDHLTNDERKAVLEYLKTL